MRFQKFPTVLALVVSSVLPTVGIAAKSFQDYPIEPVPFTNVKITDGFWSPRLDTNRLRTVWYEFKRCEDTGRIDNFSKAAKQMPGSFEGNAYDDSDVYKVIEGAAYTLAEQRDLKLENYLDALIDKIAAAQEPDGYLYTARTINPAKAPSRASKERWLNERGGFNGGNDSHELYNAGHLYEAAVAYYQATGKRKLLGVALKNADLIDRTWGPQPGKLKIPPGHQEIGIGLVKLYRVTGDRKYLNLAKFLLDCRGRYMAEAPRNMSNFNAVFYSDNKPVTEQTEAEGHAVRSAYMYSAMTDIAALTGDKAYLHAVDALWRNVVGKKLYLTGGIGASRAGEAFGANYELPNATAYNETCAAVGNALWNERMFLLHGDARYVDVLERVIYNGFLAGVAFTGDRFFYPNPLESDGKWGFNQGSNQRSPWFKTSCCPVNIVRFLPQIGGYIYARRSDDLYVNLFISSDAKVDLNDVPVAIQQRTHYPWDGRVILTLSPSEPKEFNLHLRIPGWERNQPVPSDLYHYDDGLQPETSLTLNGAPLNFQMTNGFAECRRVWHSGDTVVLNLEMPVRRVVANPKVKADQNCFAIERGPLVYCAEGADNNGKVLPTIMPGQTGFELEKKPLPLGNVRVIQVESAGTGASLRCIPYYAWCNRGPNEMRVWQPTRPPQWEASHCAENDSVDACFDGREPASSSDQSIPRFTWWDHLGTREWVLRRFESPRTVSEVQVYWFDDTGKGGCRVPQNWELYCHDGMDWRPVTTTNEFGIALNRFNSVRFSPVTTDALKIEAQLQTNRSGGILEWKILP